MLKSRLPKELQSQGAEGIKFNFFLSSAKLGLHGSADAIIETHSGSAVLELKAQPRKLSRGAEIQLAAYVMLLEETSHSAKSFGYFIQGKPVKVIKFGLDDGVRAQVIDTTRKIENIVINGALPDSDSAEAKCAQCEFLNYCNDRD